MIVQQTQNAFNDKAAQFILISLGGAIAISVESLAGIMIALPFVLFAPLAGWLSDRCSKRNVMVGAAVFQVLILGWMSLAVWAHSMPWALGAFFALAVQSSFFSPAKIGINKELVGSKHLGFAAGVQQMMTMLAILGGQVIAGKMYDLRYQAEGSGPNAAWDAALWPLVIVTALSVPAVGMAWIVPRVPSQSSEPLRARILLEHFRHLKNLWIEPGIRRCSFGIAFFWGFGAFLNLWAVKVAKELTQGGPGFGTLQSVYMAAASLGMVGGFGMSAYLLRRRIELGWVPVSGILMTLCTGWLALADPRGQGFLGALVAVAFFAAMFLGPLNAWIQDKYPASQRGEMQGAVGLQDCIAGIFAVAAIEVMARLAPLVGLDTLQGYRWQLLPVAITCAIATWYVLNLLPAHFIRVVGITAIRMVYRIRVVHADRVPMHGGALLVPNHVTYADAFFISAATPRPVRFVMDEAFMENRWIRVFARVFDTVPIRQDQPREAIRLTIEALREGHLVCLFPEGQLTRTGSLMPLKRGFALIARKAEHPLIPMWIDGSWTSIFSFERGRYFRKRPYQLPIELIASYGRPIASDRLDVATVRDGLMRASALSISRRFLHPSWNLRMGRRRLAGNLKLADANPAVRRRFWVNGYQIGQVNALQRNRSFRMLGDEPLLAELAGLTACFADLFHARVIQVKIENARRGHGEIWIGGARTREALELGELVLTADSVFYDFSPQAHIRPLAGAISWQHCPGLAINGVVIALSMPDPRKSTAGSPEQAGGKPGTLGRLLPGWFINEGESESPTGTHGARFLGPAAPPRGFRVPAGMALDADGFLAVGGRTLSKVEVPATESAGETWT